MCILIGIRATATGEDLLEYRALVSYSSSLCDCLLCIHYVAIVLMEIRHLQPTFYIKVNILKVKIIFYFFYELVKKRQ